MTTRDWIRYALISESVLVVAGVATMLILSHAGMNPQDSFQSGLTVMLLPVIVIVCLVFIASILL